MPEINTPEQEKLNRKAEQRRSAFSRHVDNCDQCRVADLEEDTDERSMCPEGLSLVASYGRAALALNRALEATVKITVGTTKRDVPPVI